MTIGNAALVLSGGGARGAYQAGILLGLLERGLLPGGPSQFSILVGTSAGSIHATALAAYADRFDQGVVELVEIWRNIRFEQVFRRDVFGLCANSLQWVRDLSLGGLLGGVKPKALLDTAPLEKLLRLIPFHRIPRQIESGRLTALAVPTTEYYSKDSVVFLQGKAGLPTWSKVRARVELAEIGIKHLMASAAIPLFFPTVEMRGRHYGDGCLRNTSPLAPAIRLGADRILAVGVHEQYGQSEQRQPTVADVAGTVLDAVMMDALEVDVAHCRRINESLVANDPEFRRIEVLWLAPSRPFAPLVRKMMHRIPALIRYLLRGLGGDRAAAELASYLLFDADFCTRLIQLGRKDVARREDEIGRFLNP